MCENTPCKKVRSKRRMRTAVSTTIRIISAVVLKKIIDLALDTFCN